MKCVLVYISILIKITKFHYNTMHKICEFPYRQYNNVVQRI